MRVLVTGAGQGIGLAILEGFLAAGHEVSAFDPAYVTEPAGPTRRQPEHRFNVNVADPSAVQAATAEAAQLMGGLDVVVNNAGIGGPRKAAADFTDQEWRDVHAVNLDGAFYVVRAALPHLRRSSGASIINIITTSVKQGLPLRLPYVTSKAALQEMTISLARELGPEGIRCNAILPGSIENPRGDLLLQARAERMGVSFEEARNYRLGFISMRTRVRPEDIANMALFLASDAAAHVTGQAIAVDGNVEWED